MRSGVLLHEFLCCADSLRHAFDSLSTNLGRDSLHTLGD
jgi:hypothetical protein